MTQVGRPIKPKKLLSVQEIAEYINTTPQYIYKMVHYKKIPHIKLGKKLLFELKIINEWLNKKRVDA
jgi:excisionase family DNA binding protein